MTTSLMFFEGIMGSGKTTAMSIQAHLYAQKANATLFSNYGLKGSRPFTSFADFKEVAAQPTSVIALDESHMDISNRDFSTNSVKWFVNMIWFIRKMRCTLMMTSPLFENIDSKVRQVTNVLVKCDKYRGYLHYDYFDVQRGLFLHSKKISLDKVESVMGHVFDSYSMVTPLEYPEKRNEFQEVMEQTARINDKYVATSRGILIPAS